MKNIKIHEKYRGNLASIKSVDDNYADTNYFVLLISDIFSLVEGNLYVEASRPTYNYEISELNICLMEMLKENNRFSVRDSEIFFCCEDISENLLEVLPKIWFAYEHVSFCFTNNMKNEADIKRKAWREITINRKAYVIFKGIEEDVVWIGKSNELEFPAILR